MVRGLCFPVYKISQPEHLPSRVLRLAYWRLHGVPDFRIEAPSLHLPDDRFGLGNGSSVEQFGEYQLRQVNTYWLEMVFGHLADARR